MVQYEGWYEGGIKVIFKEEKVRWRRQKNTTVILGNFIILGNFSIDFGGERAFNNFLDAR